MRIHIINKKSLSRAKSSGFTLIELLVVVAIIGLLASVVLASTNSARNKAKDADIKEEVAQFATLLNLNYNDYGSYCNLSAGFINSVGACNTLFTGTYASQAQQICNNIYNNANAATDPTIRLEVGASTSSPWVLDCATKYSLMVSLNNGKWFCAGSRGIKGEYTNYSNYNDAHDFVTPGCYTQP